MSYLLANGCSFVWGDELEGFDTNPPSHYHLRFSDILAKKLDLPLVNLATCGACNYKIFRDTTDFLRKTDRGLPSHIVIMWSAWQRDEVPEAKSVDFDKGNEIQRWQSMTQISPTRMGSLDGPLAEILDIYYDYMDVGRLGMIRTINYMNHLQWLCDQLGIKLIQGAFHKRMMINLLNACKPKYTKNEDYTWAPWVKYMQDALGSLKPTSRIGLGGPWEDMYSIAKNRHSIKPYGHPDESAQIEFADMFYDIFQNEFDK